MLLCFSSFFHTLFLRIGLLGTGFSDAELQELSSSLCSKVIATPKVRYFILLSGLFFCCNIIYVLLPEFLLVVMVQIIQQYYRVDDGLSPDVWFEPTEVGLCLSFTNIDR